MHDDRERWNAKHAAADAAPALDACDPMFLRLLPPLPFAGARAADLACGSGRHTLELLRRGWRTCAVDVSDVALRTLQRRAGRSRAPLPLLETVVADLTAVPPFTPAFDLVVVVSFLERSLLPRLQQLLRPGGHLLYVTFTTAWPEPKPSARYRLAEGELARGVPGFATLQAVEAGGRAGLLGQRR